MPPGLGGFQGLAAPVAGKHICTERRDAAPHAFSNPPSPMCSQGCIPFPSPQEAGVLLCLERETADAGKPAVVGSEGTRLSTKGGGDASRGRPPSAHAPGCAAGASAAWCRPSTGGDPEGLCSEETRWLQMETLPRPVVRALFSRKTKGRQADGASVEAHSGGLTGTQACARRAQSHF